jgi:hypothetical protein
MRKLLFALFATLCALTTLSQNPNGRQRNTIYVLDCTKSMSGYKGAPNIWGPTKHFLKSELEKTAQQTPGSKVVILPFQDKVLTPIHVNTNDIAWPQLEATLDRYVNNVTATNICDAWLDAEKYIDQACDNYIVLMTDGHDNIGGEANEPQRTARLMQILQAFCGKYANTNGFYVELTKQATLPNGIKDVIDVCRNLDIVDASDGIPPFGCYSSNDIDVNTRDLPLDLPLSFSNAGTFVAKVINDDNPYLKLSVKGNKISRGRVVIHIESKLGDNIETLNKTIGTPIADIPFEVYSDEVHITNPALNIKLHTTPLRTLEIAAEDGKLSSAVKRVKPFLWVKGNVTDTLCWSLNPRFNEAAQADNSAALFKLKSDSDLSGYTLQYNGNELTSDSLVAVTANENAVVELIIPQTERDSRVDISLVEISAHNLDRINGTHPNGLTLKLDGKISTSMSILEIVALSLLALIALFIVLWFLLIRDRKYPKFSRGIINIQAPYFATIRVKKARMVVLGPTKKTQSRFDAIWKGKIIYHVNQSWPCDIEITPSGRNMRFRCPSRQLISDPNPLWSKGRNFTVYNPSNSSSKIEININ